MELKLDHELDLTSEELERDHNNFLIEIGTYFFILRLERSLSPTPVEKALRISHGVIRQLEDGELNWNTDMLQEIWDYYYSIPVKRDIFSRLKARNKNGLLARLIKIGFKRAKFQKELAHDIPRLP